MDRFERSAFVILVAAAALVVATLPVVPGHDIPQHLAYVKLIVAWRADPQSLLDVYDPPDLSNGYATTYRLLALLAERSSPETALRIVLVAYVVFLALAVRALVRATYGGGARSEASALVAPLVALNPVLCMGLLPYLLALVPLTAGAAVAILHLRTGQRRWLAALATFAATTSRLHLVAGAALAVFVGLLALFRRDRRAILAAAMATAGVLVAARASALPAASGGLGTLLVHNVRVYGLVDGTVGTFRISTTHWLEKADQFAASVLGPFPIAEKLAVLAAFAAVVFAAWQGRGRGARAAKDEASTTTAPIAGVRPACAAFAVLAAAAPAAIQVPDDVSLFDFRLVTTATVLGVAAMPPALLAGAPRSVAVAVAAVLGLWAHQLAGTAGEVMETVRLTDRLGPRDRLLALPMHDVSAHLDERNVVLHYAAVYHTARHGGVTSLFWGKFNRHLPVGYRAGREPAHPPDWAPWLVEDAQLAAFSHVLVRWPHEDDDVEVRDLASRVGALVAAGVLEVVACDGGSCLLSVGPPRSSPPSHSRGSSPARERPGPGAKLQGCHAVGLATLTSTLTWSWTLTCDGNVDGDFPL